MKEVIDHQVKTYQDGHIRSFLDVYIKEIKEAEEKNENSDFTQDQLIMICTDFLLPGLTAVNSQIAFLFRTLLHHPDVLKNIQDEIENVVGSGRLPELDDRIK